MYVSDLEIYGVDTKLPLNWVSCYLRGDLPKPVGNLHLWCVFSPFAIRQKPIDSFWSLEFKFS